MPYRKTKGEKFFNREILSPAGAKGNSPELPSLSRYKITALIAKSLAKLTRRQSDTHKSSRKQYVLFMIFFIMTPKIIEFIFLFIVCLLPLERKLHENRNVPLPFHPVSSAPRTGPMQSGYVVHIC